MEMPLDDSLFAPPVTLEQCNKDFQWVLQNASIYASCKKVWRMAASMERCDVLSALLSQSFDREAFAHGLHWSINRSKAMLEAYSVADRLAQSCRETSASTLPTRL